MTRDPRHNGPDIDRIAMLLSGLCLLHCLALPLALLAMPVIAGFAGSHWHLPMLALALPVSIAAIVMGYRRHGKRWLVTWGTVGLLLLITGATVAHSYWGTTADTALTVAGSLLLAWVHWQNSRLLRRAKSMQRLAMAESA